MLLSSTKTEFTYANEQSEDITGVEANFTIFELFGNTEGKTHTCRLKILLSEYNSNILPEQMSELLRTKMSTGIDDGTIRTKLNSFDWIKDENRVIIGAKIYFRTINADLSNSTMIDDYVSVTKDEADGALTVGLSGVLSLVKEKLVTEFTATLSE